MAGPEAVVVALEVVEVVEVRVVLEVVKVGTAVPAALAVCEEGADAAVAAVLEAESLAV